MGIKTTKGYILWFEECGREDFESVGGKGASLGEMTREGIRVPPGLCVTTKAYTDLLNRGGISKEVFSILNQIKKWESIARI